MAGKSKKKKKTVKIFLTCQSCKARNYVKSKKKTAQYTVQVNKFCPKERKHTIHKEQKLK